RNRFRARCPKAVLRLVRPAALRLLPDLLAPLALPADLPARAGAARGLCLGRRACPGPAAPGGAGRGPAPHESGHRVRTPCSEATVNRPWPSPAWFKREEHRHRPPP